MPDPGRHPHFQKRGSRGFLALHPMVGPCTYADVASVNYSLKKGNCQGKLGKCPVRVHFKNQARSQADARLSSGKEREQGFLYFVLFFLSCVFNIIFQILKFHMWLLLCNCISLPALKNKQTRELHVPPVTWSWSLGHELGLRTRVPWIPRGLLQSGKKEGHALRPLWRGLAVRPARPGREGGRTQPGPLDLVQASQGGLDGVRVC